MIGLLCRTRFSWVNRDGEFGMSINGRNCGDNRLMKVQIHDSTYNAFESLKTKRKWKQHAKSKPLCHLSNRYDKMSPLWHVRRRWFNMICFTTEMHGHDLQRMEQNDRYLPSPCMAVNDIIIIIIIRALDKTFWWCQSSECWRMTWDWLPVLVVMSRSLTGKTKSDPSVMKPLMWTHRERKAFHYHEDYFQISRRKMNILLLVFLKFKYLYIWNRILSFYQQL